MKSKKIVCVDDSKTILKILSKTFLNFGYETIEIISGEQAFSYFGMLAETDLPFLITLDMKLPDTSGQDILYFLRKKYKFHTVPIVMVSAEVMDVDIIESKKMGADYFIPKPVQVPELREIVKHFELNPRNLQLDESFSQFPHFDCENLNWNDSNWREKFRNNLNLIEEIAAKYKISLLQQPAKDLRSCIDLLTEKSLLKNTKFQDSIDLLSTFLDLEMSRFKEKKDFVGYLETFKKIAEIEHFINSGFV